MRYKVTAEYILQKELTVVLKDGETDALDPANWEEIVDEDDTDIRLADVLDAEVDNG